MDKKIIEYWIAEYEKTGRIAFYHPRKNAISLNGGRSIPVAEAIKRIKECLERAKEKQKMENYKNQKVEAQKYSHVQSDIFAIYKFRIYF